MSRCQDSTRRGRVNQGSGSIIPNNLPPDPEEAGKLTLDGFDFDNDDVSDDIQSYIAIENQNSEKYAEH